MTLQAQNFNSVKLRSGEICPEYSRKNTLVENNDFIMQPYETIPRIKLRKATHRSRTDMGKLRPAGQIRPAGSFILARPFFPLKITDGSDFQKNKPQQCKIEMKNEVKIFYFGDYFMLVISKKEKKKRSSPCFPISGRPATSTVFPNLALCVKSLSTLGLEPSTVDKAFKTKTY